MVNWIYAYLKKNMWRFLFSNFDEDYVRLKPRVTPAWRHYQLPGKSLRILSNPFYFFQISNPNFEFEHFFKTFIFLKNFLFTFMFSYIERRVLFSPSPFQISLDHHPYSRGTSQFPPQLYSPLIFFPLNFEYFPKTFSCIFCFFFSFKFLVSDLKVIDFILLVIITFPTFWIFNHFIPDYKFIPVLQILSYFIS